jgi:hypothetical protein
MMVILEKNGSLKNILTNRIAELKKEREIQLNAVAFSSAKIEELERLQTTIDDFCYQQMVGGGRITKEEQRKNIQENIKRNTLKDVLTDPDDARRINFFIRFREKCGEETNYRKCHEKMDKPRLETVLYRKNRLWNNWKDFLEDYRMWTNREGRWSNVLVK